MNDEAIKTFTYIYHGIDPAISSKNIKSLSCDLMPKQQWICPYRDE